MFFGINIKRLGIFFRMGILDGFVGGMVGFRGFSFLWEDVFVVGCFTRSVMVLSYGVVLGLMW